jgi:hypothetical protein
VRAATAELEQATGDDDVVVEVRRWSPPVPTAEELAELEAKHQAAEAAADAATERVIAQAIATGMTDPAELPEVRRGFLRRKTGYYSPAPARVTRHLAEATQAAVAARVAAEQAAHEQAIQARTEAQRRTVAEQLASETSEQVAIAHHARAQAEEAALRASVEREAAEADARAAAEAAADALAARVAAETRARDLATSLEEARAALLEQTKATLAAEQARAAAPPPPPDPATPRATPAHRQPEPKIKPEGVPELVEFRSPSSSAVVTVLLGIGALVAAAAAVYQAYLDQLTTRPGIVASAVTLVLVIVVGRSKGSPGQVWLEHGVLHVDDGDSHRRFDLTTPNTKVEMVGQPGDRRWKVLFLRKGMAPYEVNARLVDPGPFVDALRPWRPRLTG